MIRIFSLVMLSGVVGMFLFSPAWAEQSMLFSVSSQSTFQVGEYPFINGTATDSDGNPLQDVEIQANFPSRMAITETDSAGKFSITSYVPAELGEHTVTVFATKDKMYLNTQITYQVIDSQQQQRMTTSGVSEKESNPEEDIPKKPKYDNSKYDLFSRMILDNIEEQKIENEKKEVFSEEQQQIKEQRILSQKDLEDDLKSFEKQNEFYNARNAFLRFLADVDYSVKNLFWQQFLFTEKITEEAQEAKKDALEEGKSSVEATKIFQQEAAVSRNEIIEYNKDLSIKYGNATSNIQEHFDENGKLPRTE